MSTKVPLSQRPRTVRNAAFILAVLYILIFSGIVYATSGVVRAPNNQMPLSVALFLGFAFMIVLSLFPLVFAFKAFRRKDTQAMGAFAIATFVCIFCPSIVHRISPVIARFVERQDFEKVGMDQLRQEAAAFATSEKTKSYPQRWFGGEVPSPDKSKTLEAISWRAGYVTADANGLVLVTDGMGNWRGGYRITPTGSAYVPPDSLKIADGFFYVLLKLDNPPPEPVPVDAQPTATPPPGSPRRLW